MPNGEDWRLWKRAKELEPLEPPLEPPPVEPPPTDFIKRREWWLRQLEEYSKQAEVPMEPRGLAGLPLYEPKSWWDKLIVFLSGGVKYRSIWEPIPKVVDREGNPLIETTWEEAPWVTQEFMRQQADAAINNSARAQFFIDFYSQLPLLVSAGVVTSYEDYLGVTGESGTLLTPQDIAEAELAIESVVQRAEEIPEWLELEPEKEAVVREFLEKGVEPLPGVPVNINQLTTEEIMKALQTPIALVARLPEGMTAEEMLSYASVMDLPPESIAAAFDIDQAVRVIRDATLEKEQMIADVKAGIREWEPPDMTFWEKAFFMVQSPMQQFADIIKPYLEHVSYPLAGTVTLMIQRAIPGTQDVERFYDRARSEGVDPWHAAGKSWEEWDLAWYWKLPIEILTDPITYTPGILLSVPGKIATRVGLKTLGRALISVNQGLWDVLDIPFDVGKHFLGKFPRTTNQIIRHELDNFTGTFNAAVARQTGKAVHQFTSEDVALTLRSASEAFVANPRMDGSAIVDLGRYLSEHVAMTDKQIYLWSRRHAGRLPDDVPVPVVSEVNQIITDSVMRVGSPAANAKRMARALMVEETPENITKLVKEIPAFSKKLSTSIDTVIQIGRTAQLEPVARMLNYMAVRQKAVIGSRLAGKQSSGSLLEGIALGLQRSVDKIENMRWRQLLDRYVVRTFAEANLGSISYPIWNAFEGIFVSLIEGVTPRFVKWEAYNVMVKGLMGDPKLAVQTASDVAGIFGTVAGRRAGAISLMPGVIPTRIRGWNVPKWAAGKDWLEWTGRKWIQISDVWGNAFRRNYVVQKMARYLAERAYDVAGQDVNLALQRLVKGSPRISKQTLGLSQHELEQEMFRRLSVSVDDVLALKDILTDGSLMQGEMMKALRKADHLSPRAKALGEQLIHEGKVLKDTDSIVDFVRQISDAAIEDLRRYPVEVSDSFRYVANQIDTAVIETRNDLMEIFTHYETMSETASFIPHRLMSQVMEEADLLYRAGRFGQIDPLWRKARQELLDTMQDITSSLEIVKNKILVNSNMLTSRQRVAMESVLERSEAGNLIRETTLRQDGQLLDDFFALPREMRTPDEYTALRAYRAELWENYRLESAVPSAGEFITRRDLAQLYHNLPEPKLTPVDASGRALSTQDIANVFGVNIDGLVSGMLDNIAMHGKPYFIQLVRQSAESRPHLFKGFTEEKIAVVYDNILAQARMRPDMDIVAQKILQQTEGVKQELISLKMRHSLTPNEEVALHGWIDNAAAGREEVIGGRGLVSQDDWDGLRQGALDAANKDYYKAFADYTHENIIGATMKMIYPYWTYHTYRWFFLSRTALRHPGVPAAWGKYQNYGEYGFQPTPIPNVEANPFIGSVVGTTFTLTRFDFASYYENLGFAGEILDWTQRIGFYPGIHVMGPIALTSYFSDRPLELGEILPPIARSGLNLLVNSNIPGVSSAAKWLKDMVFHENFHEYYTSTILDNKQVEAEGTLIEGQTGTDLWFRKLRGEKLTDEEQQLWDESYEDAAWVGLLRSQFPQFRLRTEDYREAYKQVTMIFEEYLGMSEAFQKDLWRHHQRPTDVVGGLPLDVRMALDELWQWKIYFGRGVILNPPEVADLKALIDKYWDKIKDYQEDRLALQADIDQGFLYPTKELHFDGREWRIEYAKNWGDYSSKTKHLEEDREFADAVEALTPEGQARLAKRLGFSVPPTYPMDEAINLYFDIELERYTDPYTGEEDWDFLTFWLKREAVRMALTEEQRADFDTYVRRYQTPMEMTFRKVYNIYIRGYRASDRIMFESYSEEQKAIIKEFYADTTSLTRKDEIREILSETGRKLIAEYEAKRSDARLALRTVSPTLDFWLYVFGYITKPRTPEARAMIDRWEADRSSILMGQE